MDIFDKFKEIVFKDVPTGIEVHKYCEHNKKFVIVRDSPLDCQNCLKELKDKYLNEKGKTQTS